VVDPDGTAELNAGEIDIIDAGTVQIRLGEIGLGKIDPQPV
jgi:hypothetical protein